MDGIKHFMEENFDFDTLKKIGFYGKDIKRKDYLKQADRVCHFFGIKSVFEYKNIGANCQGYHITETPANFECPICTCPQYLTHTIYGWKKIRCKGCKRHLKVYDCNTHFDVVAADDINDNTKTHF